MKKTLVALSVLVAASAQAGVELYNQDALSVTLSGDIEVRYLADLEKDSNPAQEIDDADLEFDISYQINDDLTGSAYYAIEDQNNAGDAYVALHSNTYGSLRAGRTCTILDDAGIGSDYAFGLNTFFEDSEVYCADEIVRYDVDKGNWYAGLAVAQDMNGSMALQDSGSHVDAKFGYRLDALELIGFYGSGSVGESLVGTVWVNDDVSVDETLWSVQAKYTGIENLALAIAYYDTTAEAVGFDDVTGDTIALAATYTMGKMTYAAGYAASSSSENLYNGVDENGTALNEKDLNSWYLNAGYAIAPTATIYAEIGADNGFTETAPASGTYTENEMGYAIGVQASF